MEIYVDFAREAERVEVSPARHRPVLSWIKGVDPEISSWNANAAPATSLAPRQYDECRLAYRLVDNGKGTQVLELNVGNADRLLRVLLGAVLIGLAVFGRVGFWGYLGVVPLVTGAMAFCPVYSLFRFSTTAR